MKKFKSLVCFRNTHESGRGGESAGGAKDTTTGSEHD